MKNAEKWIFLMIIAVVGLFIGKALFPFVHGEPITTIGKIWSVFMGCCIGLWICSFIEFIIVMVRNKRRKRGVR